jgi:hypothetical protein
VTLGDSIFATCIANVALAALVGQRIFPIQAPQQAEKPYVVWQKVSSDPIATHSEQNSEADSFNRVQFTVVASDFEKVAEISAALVAALDGVAVLANHPAILEGDQDIPSEDPAIYARAIDFTF